MQLAKLPSLSHIALVLMALLAACDAERQAAAPSAITIAGTTFPDTEGERHWLTFRDRLLAETNGELPLRMLIYGQLGSEDQLLVNNKAKQFSSILWLDDRIQ